MLAKHLLTRALLTRNVVNAAKQINKQAIRNGSHGSWAYRCPPEPPSKRAIILAEVIGGLCWYWILYHIATEPEHIYGEWPYVYPSTWSDLELGVPPKSAGPLRE